MRSFRTVASDGLLQPLVSVVVEGYNEVKLATSVTDVLDDLANQDYPLDRVELILVGNAEQYREWAATESSEARFRRSPASGGGGHPVSSSRTEGSHVPPARSSRSSTPT